LVWLLFPLMAICVTANHNGSYVRELRFVCSSRRKGWSDVSGSCCIQPDI